jgi:hypothetical protein
LGGYVLKPLNPIAILKKEYMNNNDYWNDSGDAEYQKAVDKWANARYGENWRLKCEVYNMEKLYDSYLRTIKDKTGISA